MTEQNAEQQPQASSFTRLKALVFLIGSLAVGAVVIVLMTLFVIGSAPRNQAVAEDETVRVEEYMTLPDEDAYPAALAISADGTLYTGSYQSGTLWKISADRVISEVAGTRYAIGSVSGLEVAPDGSLLVLDRIVPLDAQGAIIWRISEDTLSQVVKIPHDESIGVVLPDDITVDSEGRIYITDRKPARIWRYSADGTNEGIWWIPNATADAQVFSPTGLAYDPVNDAILVTDSELDAIYRIPASSADMNATAEAVELIYVDSQENDYSLDGITVSPTGDIFVALLGWNRVARLDGDTLTMLAKDFRGASDVAYDSAKDALYVTNWNQFSLGFGTRPQLPFALDIVELSPDPIAE